jgi:hypothetical protein
LVRSISFSTAYPEDSPATGDESRIWWIWSGSHRRPFLSVNREAIGFDVTAERTGRCGSYSRSNTGAKRSSCDLKVMFGEPAFGVRLSAFGHEKSQKSFPEVFAARNRRHLARLFLILFPGISAAMIHYRDPNPTETLCYPSA